MVNQLSNFNYVQAGVSLVSAIIVGLISLSYNKRKYYQQQWWHKQYDKYEELIILLSNLEQYHYEYKTHFETSKSLNIDNLPENSVMMMGLKKYSQLAHLYFDEECSKSLNDLYNTLEAAEAAYDHHDPLDICSVVWGQIKQTKQEVIKMSKQRLNIK